MGFHLKHLHSTLQEQAAFAALLALTRPEILCPGFSSTKLTVHVSFFYSNGELESDCPPAPCLLSLRLKAVVNTKPSALVYLELGLLGTKLFLQ